MVSVDTEVTRRNGVTFVRAVVTNDRETPQRVRLRNRLDGPVWPPRFGDVTAPEWHDGTWESVVEPGQRLGIGYASPAAPEPASDPLELVSASRSDADRSADPAAVIASLDRWAPEQRNADHRR